MVRPDNDRARRTLYVTGYDSRFTSKRLLEELFLQGGPIVDITMLDTHAYVLFQHEESVPYCLALFNEVELHGQKLRLNPRCKLKNAFCYLRYLVTVRKKLMAEFRKMTPPQLPPKKVTPKRPYRLVQKAPKHKKRCKMQQKKDERKRTRGKLRKRK